MNPTFLTRLTFAKMGVAEVFQNTTESALVAVVVVQFSEGTLLSTRGVGCDVAPKNGVPLAITVPPGRVLMMELSSAAMSGPVVTLLSVG